LKARDFLICAVAIPLLYMAYLILGVSWDAVTAVFHFFASVSTNAASFTVVGFVLAVVSAVCAITAFRELEDNRFYWIESWKQLGEQHALNLRWYGLALVGAALGVLQAYMVKTMPAAPVDIGFRAWVVIIGMTAGAISLAGIVVAFVASVWTFLQDWRARIA
jgi:hypothetical protein